ncbi:MAG TPA: sigma-70 family RNA polymerase sigma factor [Bauldia sp.]|nr:sigma-70 family RNA polymerase sigma factor [Bauldia sp.]
MAQGPDRERIRLDGELMARIAEGDQAAFAILVANETPRLLRLTRSLLSARPAEAEEIVQEALIRLWREAEAWRPDGKVATWLHRVAYRLSIDALRRLRPSVAIESVAEIEDAGVPHPETRLMRIDDVAAVRDAMSRLPERQRTALVLSHFQELSQAEGAEVMGLGEAAYESLLARARRGLRALLLKEEKGREP